MFVVYEQRWEGKLQASIHRSPMDIGEFAKNHTPELVREGGFKEVKQKDTKLMTSLEGKLGVWK